MCFMTGYDVNVIRIITKFHLNLLSYHLQYTNFVMSFNCTGCNNCKNADFRIYFTHIKQHLTENRRMTCFCGEDYKNINYMNENMNEMNENT